MSEALDFILDRVSEDERIIVLTNQKMVAQTLIESFRDGNLVQRTATDCENEWWAAAREAEATLIFPPTRTDQQTDKEHIIQWKGFIIK